MNSVGWFEISIKYMQRARVFYEGAFSKKLQILDSSSTLGVSEQRAFRGNPLGGDSAIETSHYLVCPRCDVETSHVGKNGREILKGKLSIDQYVNIALVTDTEGNIIGLLSMN